MHIAHPAKKNFGVEYHNFILGQRICSPLRIPPASLSGQYFFKINTSRECWNSSSSIILKTKPFPSENDN